MSSEQKSPLDIGEFASNPLYRVEVKANETSEETRSRLELEKVELQARLDRDKIKEEHIFRNEQEEKNHRHEIEKDREKHKMRMELIAVLVLGLLLGLASYLLIHPGVDETVNPNREIAEKIIVAVIAAVGGYGLGSKKNEA